MVNETNFLLTYASSPCDFQSAQVGALEDCIASVSLQLLKLTFKDFCYADFSPTQGEHKEFHQREKCARCEQNFCGAHTSARRAQRYGTAKMVIEKIPVHELYWKQVWALVVFDNYFLSVRCPAARRRRNVFGGKFIFSLARCTFIAD